MATQFENVREQVTADGNSTIYKTPRGGVVLLELSRTAGTATFSLEVKLNGTWVPFRDTQGSLVTVDMDATTEHFRFEFISHVDVRYRVVTSSASSADFHLRLGRTVSE